MASDQAEDKLKRRVKPCANPLKRTEPSMSWRDDVDGSSPGCSCCHGQPPELGVLGRWVNTLSRDSHGECVCASATRPAPTRLATAWPAAPSPLWGSVEGGR